MLDLHEVHLYKHKDLAGLKYEANNISREFFSTDSYLRRFYLNTSYMLLLTGLFVIS